MTMWCMCLQTVCNSMYSTKYDILECHHFWCIILEGEGSKESIPFVHKKMTKLWTISYKCKCYCTCCSYFVILFDVVLYCVVDQIMAQVRHDLLRHSLCCCRLKLVNTVLLPYHRKEQWRRVARAAMADWEWVTQTHSTISNPFLCLCQTRS